MKTKTYSALLIIGALLTACGGFAGGGISVTPTPQDTPSPSQNGSPPSEATATEKPVAVLQPVAYPSLDYCFAFPQGFILQINDGQMVEIIGTPTTADPIPAIVWITATDPQGQSAREIADGELLAVGGSHPESTVMLGGEEALVLDGMPGQDPIRKVYIVHSALLYTLNFTPYDFTNFSAGARLEALYASVTSTWVWISSGNPCPGAG